MKYSFSNSSLNLKERIIGSYSSFDYDDIFNNDFVIDYNQEALIKGREVFLNLKGSKVLIIGDFDCDGICATTIIKDLLDHLGIASNYYIPSRFNEGYGLSLSHVQKAIDYNFDVLLTVDNGIVANEAIKKAKEANIKTIIIDHHEYDELPDADYILHGRLLKREYEKACASGLCYLLSSMFKSDDKILALSGIATNADMVEVFGYNRHLIKMAKKILNEGNIKAINAISGKKANYTYDDLSFLVASKINSISRIDKGSNVNILPKYLLEEDDIKLLDGADKIKKINNLRKDLSDVMSKKALTLVDDSDFCVIYDEYFLEGLCGLVANKVAKNIHKPCLILAPGKDLIKGSARSVDDFDILHHLKNFETYFETLGGHKQAAGVALKKEALASFIKEIKATPCSYEDKMVNCIPLYDDELNDDTLNLLIKMQPFGTGFEEPLFYLDNVNVKSRYLIKQMYTKFQFDNGLGAISFKRDDYDLSFSRVVGYLKEDSYRKNHLSMQIQALF